MAEMNCGACEDIRNTSPEFIVNGLTDDICTSFQNDTGLNPSDDHNDCTDLHNLNDCLVGNEATELESYDVCDWKTFMKQFIPNLWTVLKAIICAICGIWTNIHNLWNSLNGLIDKINCVYNGLIALGNGIGQTTGGQSFVRYYRDNSGTGGGDMYYWSVKKGASHILNLYMDADLDNAGSKVADRDYVVIVSNCTDLQDSNAIGLDVTFFSSGDTRSMSTIRKRQAQHPQMPHATNNQKFYSFSWTTTGAVLIKKGEHLKVEAYCYTGTRGKYRLHQFSITWIPVNISSAFDPSQYLPTC